MTGALALTAALMGLAATPHCATMCAGLCAAASSSGVGDRATSVGAVQAAAAARGGAVSPACTPALPGAVPVLLGRLAGYAGVGALAAATYQSVRWLGEAVDWAKPFWHIAQGLLLALGLMLLLRGSFPAAWVSRAEVLQTRWRQWRRPGVRALPSPGQRFTLALLWPLLPCGALHAAVLVAALASSPAEGAGVMLAFGVASSPGLLLGERIWRVLRSRWWTLRGRAPTTTMPTAQAPAVGIDLTPGWAPVRLTRRGGASAAPPVLSDTLPLRLAGAALAASVAWGLVGARWFPVLQAWCA